MTTETRALPDHGTLRRHKLHACRCIPCVDNSRAYDANRARQIAYGTWAPRVDAQPVRDHIAMLAEAGIGWMRVAELAGLSSGILSRWLYGSANCPVPKKVDAANAAAVLAVRPTLDNAADRALIDATGTRRRVQALIRVGYPQAYLSARVGWDRSNFTKLLHARLVHAVTARRIRDLFAEIWDVAPETVGVPAVSAARARSHAVRRDFAPPAAWDDIDAPDAVPDCGGNADKVAALVEDAEFIRATTGADWDQVAERLGVRLNTLHTYRSRVRERAAATAAPEPI